MPSYVAHMAEEAARDRLTRPSVKEKVLEITDGLDKRIADLEAAILDLQRQIDFLNGHDD